MKCSRCGTKIPDGKMSCPACKAWIGFEPGESEVFNLSDVPDTEEDRLHSGPWDEAWGGGMVKDSVTFFAGRPGAGKSTCLLQIAGALAAQGLIVLYVGKEETLRKVRRRACRLEIPTDVQAHIRIVSRFTGSLANLLEQERPKMLIVDSLPALVGLGWKDVSDAENTLQTIKDYAVANLCPAIVVDHINRKGEFSGPIALEHLIDVTMMMHKDKKNANLRRLIPEKSRDGAVDVQVCFLMGPKGLVYVETPDENDEDSEDSDESDV